MENVKDAMNASVLAGAQGTVAKRIAAEEGREYILHVSFFPTVAVAAPADSGVHVP